MTDNPGKIDHYEKQFGIVAIEKGFLTPDELIEALKIQVEEDIKYKTHRLIGEILLNKKYITVQQIQEVINFIMK